MSLYYHYPNTNFFKSLNKQFSSEYTDCEHISDIWDDLINNGVLETAIASFLITKGSLNLNASTATKEEIIDALEYVCRKGNKKMLESRCNVKFSRSI